MGIQVLITILAPVDILMNMIYIFWTFWILDPKSEFFFQVQYFKDGPLTRMK